MQALPRISLNEQKQRFKRLLFTCPDGHPPRYGVLLPFYRAAHHMENAVHCILHLVFNSFYSVFPTSAMR